MPAYGTTSITQQTDRTAVRPVVEFTNGAQLEFARLMSVTQRVGPLASSAELAISNVNSEDDSVNLVTLGSATELAEDILRYGTRMTVNYDGNAIFVGNLVQRVESSDAGTTTLVFHDDRWLMGKIPLRGAWVWDPYDEDVKYVDRYMPICNPGGFKNCTFGQIAGVDGTTPVFTWIAEAGTAGQSSDEAGTPAKSGDAVFWTPERILQYIRAASIADPGTSYPEYKRLDSTKVDWASAPTNFEAGVMTERIPETSLVGLSVLGAIIKIVDFAGEYGFTLEYSEGGSGPVSIPTFFRRDQFAERTGIDLNLQLDGAVSSFNSMYKYSVNTDATGLHTGVLTQGAPVQVESNWHFDPDDADDGELVKAWTDAEETAFKNVITGDGANAQHLAVQGLAGSGGTLTMDGSGGNPTIVAKSSAALQLARNLYPRVYRAFKINPQPNNTTVATRLEGSSNEYAGFPVLQAPRPIGPTQLQPYFEDTGDLRGRLRWPIRVRVASNASATTDLHDVTHNHGIEITGDGLIWINGLTDLAADEDDRIYEGSFLVDPSAVKLKHFYVNAWVPLDARVQSSKDIFDGDTEDTRNVANLIDETLSDGESKGMQFYVLAPDAYVEEHQVASEPAQYTTYPTGIKDGSQATAPLTRLMRTDSDQISKHTQRRIKDVAWIKRGGTWEMPTIRGDLASGQMVSRIVFRGTTGGGNDEFPVDRPIAEIEWDFVEQATRMTYL